LSLTKPGLVKIGGLLESEIISSASDTMTDQDTEALAEIHEKIVRGLASDDFSSYLELNRKFNELVRSFCPHPLLVELFAKIQERLYFAHNRSDSPDWNRILAADHGEIVTHLRKKDKSSLERLVRDVHWNFDAPAFIRRFGELLRKTALPANGNTNKARPDDKCVLIVLSPFFVSASTFSPK
jgi:hypothetical protein